MEEGKRVELLLPFGKMVFKTIAITVTPAFQKISQVLMLQTDCSWAYDNSRYFYKADAPGGSLLAESRGIEPLQLTLDGVRNRSDTITAAFH